MAIREKLGFSKPRNSLSGFDRDGANLKQESLG